MQNSRPRRRVWGTVVTTVDRPSNSIGVATRRDRRGCSRKTECCTRLRCQGRVEFPDIHSGRIESEGFEFSTASREIDCVVPESGSSEYRISERERLNDLVVVAGVEVAHVLAVQQKESTRFAAADEQVRDGSNRWIDQNCRPARTVVRVASIQLGLVRGRKPICHTESAGSA